MGGRFSIKKLLLDLLVIVCLSVTIWNGYLLFTYKLDHLWGVAIFLVSAGVLIWNIKIIRNTNWKYKSPKFKWVFLIAIGILFVCAFGGIQPLSNIKDGAINAITDGIDNIKAVIQTEDIVKLDDNNEIVISKPSGNYKGTIFGVEMTVKFKSGDIIESYNPFDGKRVYQYELVGSNIVMHDIATNETQTIKFKYNEDIDCVIFDGDVVFYK